MCIHVYESDSDGRVLQSLDEAILAVARSKELRSSMASYYESVQKKVETEIIRRFRERTVAETVETPAGALAGF